MLPLMSVLYLVYSLLVSRRTKIDLIHAHGFYSIIPGIIIGKILRIPCYGSPHGIIFFTKWTFIKRLVIFLQYWFLNKLDLLIQTQPTELSYFSKNRYSFSVPIITVPTGISGLSNQIRKEDSLLNHNHINILFIGRPDYAKIW